MKFISLPVLLFFLFANSSKVLAQNADSAKGWTIQDCFKYALDHNIQINTLRLSEQSSQQDLTAYKGQKIPSLSGNVGNTFNNANNNALGNGKLVNQLSSNTSYSLNSSIVLWNGNYINNNIHQQQLVAQSAGLSVQESQNNIILSITQAYLNVLLAKENEKYVKELVANTNESVKQGQMLFDAGSIAKKDLLQLQAQLASDQYLLVQTQNSIRQSLLSLKQLLQINSDKSFDIQYQSEIEVPSDMEPLEVAQEKAIDNFPEIKIGKLGVDIASIGISKARAGFLPVLKANAALGSSYYDVLSNNVIPRTEFGTQTSNGFYQTVGLTLSIPIFANRTNSTNLQKAKINYNQSNLNYENSKLILSQAVEQAYLNTLNAKKSYDAANLQLSSATESYNVVKEQLKLGGLNIYDLLTQRNQYVQAVQAFTQAKYTAILQQKIYEFYIGNPITL